MSLELHDVTIKINALPRYLEEIILFENFNLEIQQGEVSTIMGPSGSGKSTLISYICGISEEAFQTKGSISLNGKILDDCPPQKRKIAIQFQDDLLFPHLCIAENLAFAIPKKHKKETREKIVKQTLNDIGMIHHGSKAPNQVSGGERARISVMRALLSEPEALLLDEPFSKLDRKLRDYFRCFVFEHSRNRNLPVLLVTHDIEDAKAAGGAVIEI